MLGNAVMPIHTTGRSGELQFETLERGAVSFPTTGGRSQLQGNGLQKALQCFLWSLEAVSRTSNYEALQLVTTVGSGELQCVTLD